MVRNYELTVIFPEASLKSKKPLEVVEKLIATLKGTITKSNEWGRREFAYPIKKQLSGVYFYLEVDLSGDKAPVLNRELEINDEILRHLLVVREKPKKIKVKKGSKKEKETVEVVVPEKTKPAVKAKKVQAVVEKPAAVRKAASKTPAKKTVKTAKSAAKK